MISIFGVISVVIAILSVATIVLHNRVMGKRTPVDTHLAALEDLLRERIEILYQTSYPDSELYTLCTQCIDLDFNDIIKALPHIDRASFDCEEVHTDNAKAISETTAALNHAIEEYNKYITGRFPAVFMASILGLTTENLF